MMVFNSPVTFSRSYCQRWDLAVIGHWPCRKGGAEAPHSRRWRDHQASPHFAKRLDCGAFTAAVPCRELHDDVQFSGYF
jgi:hypothetical protein